MRPRRNTNFQRRAKKPIKVPKHGAQYPIKTNPGQVPKKSTQTPEKQDLRKPIQKKHTNKNRQKITRPFDSLKDNTRRKVILQLRKGSVLVPYLFSAVKPDPRLEIEKIGVSRAGPIISPDFLLKHVKSVEMIQFFESIVTHKSWNGLQNYEKQKIFNELDKLIQLNGTKQFTKKLINSKEKQKALTDLLLNKISKRDAINVLAELQSTAAIKSVLRHRSKFNKHQRIERRKILNSILNINYGGKKVINPKQQQDIIKLLMSEKSLFISNNTLKRFVTSRAGVFVLVNLIKMEKGEQVFNILTNNSKLRQKFGKYVTNPVGLRSLNHALSTPPRRNFFSRAILLAEKYKEHEAVFEIVESFIKDPSLKKVPKLNGNVNKELVKYVRQAITKLKAKSLI